MVVARVPKQPDKWGEHRGQMTIQALNGTLFCYWRYQSTVRPILTGQGAAVPSEPDSTQCPACWGHACLLPPA